jgi:hypothetical protein
MVKRIKVYRYPVVSSKSESKDGAREAKAAPVTDNQEQ